MLVPGYVYINERLQGVYIKTTERYLIKAIISETGFGMSISKDRFHYDKNFKDQNFIQSFLPTKQNYNKFFLTYDFQIKESILAVGKVGDYFISNPIPIDISWNIENKKIKLKEKLYDARNPYSF